MAQTQSPGRLIVVCGLPASGKTTLAKQLEATQAAIRFGPDEWMRALSLDFYDEDMRAKIETLQWDLGRKLLAQGSTVVIEWGTWGRSERDALRLGARELGAAVELHYLKAPIDILFERLKRRGGETASLELADLTKWADLFQEPTPDEMALFDAPLAR